MTNQHSPVDGLVTALELEIAAVLADNGSDEQKIALRDGHLLGTHDEGYDYVFSVQNWQKQTSDRFLVRPSKTRREWAQATASIMPDGKLRLTTKSDLGQNLANAQLRVDDTVSLKLLASRIASTTERTDTLNTTAASWIVGNGSPKIGRCNEPERLVRSYGAARLNDRQRLAIEHALASEATFIWGPPGTGKTEVVSRIVEGCYRQGLRVLFVAPTHVAVDQALERVCELLDREDQFTSGLVQRNGAIAVPSLERRFGFAIQAEHITSRLTSELTDRIAEFTERLGTVRADILLHRRVAAAVLKRHELTAREAQLTQLLSRPEFTEFGAGQATDPTVAHFRVMRQTAEDDLLACRTELEAVTLLLPEDLTRVSRALPMDQLQALEQDLNNQLTQTEEERKGIATAVRDRCRIMGTTVAKAVQSKTLMTAIDVVIIDEAGMVDLPSAWYAAGLAAKRVVLAGDFRQLPPVTHGATSRKATESDRKHSERWMDRDVFTAAGLVDSAGRAQPDSRMLCLDTQYRMRPGICAVVNAVAYPDSPLRTSRDDTSRLPESPLLPGSLVLVDTTSRRVPHSRGHYGAHKTNPVHEAVIHELIRGLQYDTVLPGRKADADADGERITDRLAVITPYRNQARSMKASLRHRFGDNYDNVVDTVHRFQGSQRPVVVLDTVAGAGKELGVFYSGTGLSSTTCRLLNVALSRAQDHLVVVADVGFLGERLPPGSEAAKLLDHLIKHAHHLAMDDLIPVRAAADLSGLSEEELSRPAFFPADEVARAVEWDIDHATRRLEIYCPFLDRRSVRTWLRRLEPCISAGVRVTVHTRPPDDGSVAADLVTELRQAGCEVLLRERMHEKVMIVDETVLWHGSLNLLANDGPTDLMMRITDAHACEQVRRIMTTARRERPLAPPRYRTGFRQRTESPHEVSPGDVVDGRLYLKVPFAEKNEAKRAVKARWDQERQLWHTDVNTPRAQLARWLPPTSQP